jgi:predicted nucleic-acid-binding protein
MKAVDTNVLCRFFVADDDDTQAVKQRPAAIAAMSERVFVSVTVLLEFEWVMRGVYEIPARTVLTVLQALAGIEHVTLEDRADVLKALDGLAAGLDFADALHLARSGHCSALVSFDRRLAKRARTLAIAPPVELLV